MSAASLSSLRRDLNQRYQRTRPPQSRPRPHTVLPHKLRVVYLDHVAQLSGGELALLRLLDALVEVDAHVILAEDGPLVERLARAGHSVEVLPMLGRTQRLRKDTITTGRVPIRAVVDTLAYSLRLARRLRQLRPDIVHTNSLKSGVYGSLAAPLAGTPVVWHLRDRVDTDYLPQLAVVLIRAITRYLPRAIISNSHSTQATLLRRKRSFVIPSTVEPAAAPLDRSACHRDPLVVGSVSRLAPWKGQDVLLRAFARAFPNGAQRAIIVGAPLFGAAEAAYADDLRQLARALGIGDRVEFRGHRDDVPRELAALDVLVHASIVPEPFGQVVVEGMSARLPVVASRAGGPTEIITDGVDGLLYPPGDVTQLAAILVRLQSDPGLRARLGRAAGLRADDFSPARGAAQVMAAYDAARIPVGRRARRGRDGNP